MALEPRADRLHGRTRRSSALLGKRTTAFFRCLYRTARLTYSATFIPDPVAPADDEEVAARSAAAAGAGVLAAEVLEVGVARLRAAGRRLTAGAGPAPAPPVVDAGGRDGRRDDGRRG